MTTTGVPAATRPRCLHPGCKNVAGYGRRGLCRRHFADPAVRASYTRYVTRKRAVAAPGRARCRVPDCKQPAGRGRRGLCWWHFEDKATRVQYPKSPTRPQKYTGTDLCRHCKKNKRNAGRGLCWVCAHRPGVKESYEFLDAPTNNRGMDNHNGDSRRPAEPCHAAPMSPERILAMQERIARGESVFHPQDGPTRGDLA